MIELDITADKLHGYILSQEVYAQRQTRLLTAEELNVEPNTWGKFLRLSQIDTLASIDMASEQQRPALISFEDEASYCQQQGIYADYQDGDEAIQVVILPQSSRSAVKNIIGAGGEPKKLIICVDSKGSGATKSTPGSLDVLDGSPGITSSSDISQTINNYVACNEAGILTVLELPPIMIEARNKIEIPQDVRGYILGVRLSGLCPEIQFHDLGIQVNKALLGDTTPASITEIARYQVQAYLKKMDEINSTYPNLHKGVYDMMNNKQDLTEYGAAFTNLMFENCAKALNSDLILKAHDQDITLAGELADLGDQTNLRNETSRQKFLDSAKKLDHWQKSTNQEITNYFQLRQIPEMWVRAVHLNGILGLPIPNFESFYEGVKKNLNSDSIFIASSFDLVCKKFNLTQEVVVSSLADELDDWQRFQADMKSSLI